MAHRPWKPGFGRFLGSRHGPFEWVPLPLVVEPGKKDEQEPSEGRREPKEPAEHTAGSPCGADQFVTDWVMEE